MATDKLYSILNFVGIPLGGTAALPHGLVLRDTPVTPDLVLLQFAGSFEIVSATTTTLTIRNTSNVGGDCRAWVKAIHPTERLLGLQPDDGLMTQGLTPRPFCPGSPNADAGGASAPYVVVFRPGGVASQNVVTTWADALTRLASLQGQRILEFDDSLAPVVIPVGGPYDMTNVTWSTVPDFITQVTIPEGASFTRLRTFSGRVNVRFTGTTPPIADFGQAPPQIDTVVIQDGAEVIAQGAGPMFDVDAAAQFIVGDQAAILFGTNAVVNVSAAVIVSVFAQGQEAIIGPGTFSGIVGSTLNLIAAASALFVFSQSQPAFLGTLNVANATRTRSFPTAVLTANTILNSDAPTRLVLVNPTGGAFAVTLPAAADVLGQTVRLKNTTASVNNITLTAAGGDNIDGAATLVLSGDHFHSTVTSDGVNTWYVTD